MFLGSFYSVVYVKVFWSENISPCFFRYYCCNVCFLLQLSDPLQINPPGTDWAVEWAGFSPSFILANSFMALTLTSAWFKGFPPFNTGRTPWHGPSWTITTMAFFYAVTESARACGYYSSSQVL